MEGYPSATPEPSRDESHAWTCDCINRRVERLREMAGLINTITLEFSSVPKTRYIIKYVRETFSNRTLPSRLPDGHAFHIAVKLRTSVVYIMVKYIKRRMGFSGTARDQPSRRTRCFGNVCRSPSIPPDSRLAKNIAQRRGRGPKQKTIVPDRKTNSKIRV